MNLEKLKENLVTYETYCSQILQRERNFLEGEWQLPESLLKKIDNNGNLKPFFGDTTVLILPDFLKEKLHKIQIEIEQECPFFASRLDFRQFHFTIHDLYNSPIESDISSLIDGSRREVRTLLNAYRKKYSNGNIVSFRSTTIFPSEYTALVMGFLPAFESDYNKFLELYNLLEKVRYLDYWPRPHITLNYFRPQNIPKIQMEKLKKIASRDYSIKIEIDLVNVIYQRFIDMNNYLTC